MNGYGYGFALVLWLCAVPAASAQAAAVDPRPAPVPAAADRPAWALQLSPYLWGTGIEGAISPFRNAPTLDVDKSFSEVMDDFNVGGFVNLWARRERLVLSVDLMYVSTTDAPASGPLPAFQIPGLGATIPPGASVDARVDARQSMLAALGGWRVVDTPEQATLDLLGGLRAWRVSNDVTVQASHPALGTVSGRHGEDFDWVDPVVGARAFLPVGGRTSLQAQADIGGLGVGADLTWSMLATLNYVFSDHLSASAGYKVLDVDYDQGGHVFDVRLSGPLLGLTWRF